MGKKLTKGEWAQVRELAEGGKSDSWLEDEFGVDKNTIRQRRFADKQKGDPWLTPKEMEIRARQEALARMFQNKSNGGTGEGETSEVLTVSESELSQLREETPGIIAKKTAELLLGSFPILQLPRTIPEFKALFSVFMQAAGLDKQQGPTVNIGMAWGSGSSPKDIPVKVIHVPVEK